MELQETNGKYLLMETDHNAPKPKKDSSNGDDFLFISDSSRVTKKMIDLDTSITKSYKSNSLLIYINLIFFIGFIAGSIACIWSYSPTPSITFLVIFMIRNL